MTRFAASLLVGALLASAGGALGACGSFSADAGDGDGPGDGGGDGATADAVTGDGAVDGGAVSTDGPAGDSAGPKVIEIAKGLTLPWKIAVDPSHLYVTTHATPGQVLQLAHDGSTVNVFASGLTLPTEISVGPLYVHWLAGNDVWARPLAAGQPAASYGQATPPVGLVTRPSGNVVWATATTTTDPGQLMGASPTFTNITILASQGDIASIALLVDSSLFIGLAATGGNQGLRVLDFSASFGTPLPKTDATFGAVIAMAADADRIVFAEASGTVRELKTAVFATGTAKILANAGGARAGVVLDEARQRSYWLTADGVVRRHEWASGAVSDEAQGCAAPAGLAADDGHLYWTCPNQGTIEGMAK